MAVFWILVAIITFIAASNLIHSLIRKKKRFPPGPKGIPLLGHLHMLDKNPHQDLHNIANKHGPIMYLRFGFVPIIVVSSPQAAELFLKTYDLVFASRPPHQASKYLSWGQKNISFAAYGSYWRNMRKLSTLELLSNLKINSFRSMRSKELSLFVESLKEASHDNIVVDLSAKVSSLAAEMSCRMVFGKKYEDKDIHDRGFKGVIQESEKYAAIPNLGDYFPFLEVLDLQGLNKKMKALAKVFDDFFEKVIDDHIRVKVQGQTKDIVDTMMSIMQSGEYSELQFDRPNVKAIMLDMLIASMDTAASTIEWVFSELLKNPRIMRKLQKELEEVVGLERPVEESDLDKLEYLYMVIKETFRLHPPVPLLLPHYAMEDCTINNYCIPKGSRVLINAYAIGRDPNAWSDPDKFVPERFIGSDIDVRGQHFQLIPFGTGRRGCPGIQLGLIQVRLIVAQLVHCFDWKLPNDMKPEDLDMTEEFGLVVSRTKHLMGVPSYRLHI